MGTCIFYLNERVDRVHQWAMQAFLGLGDGKTGALRGGTKKLELDLLSLRTGDICQIDMVQESTGNKVTVYCNSMEVVGDVVQDLCRSLSMSLLESTANFPRDFHNFQEILEKVEKHKQLRGRMTADMADMSHSIKSLVIRAEDSRVLCDWNVSLFFFPFLVRVCGVGQQVLFHCCFIVVDFLLFFIFLIFSPAFSHLFLQRMKGSYQELQQMNEELIGEYMKRATNHDQLMKSLKGLNDMIQRASNLRYGSAKTSVIKACRKAIKKNNMRGLMHIISQGVPKA